jgi:hypothetical protein
MSTIPKTVKTRSDAEKCVRILFREMLDGTKAFVVQLVSPVHCNECGNEELRWRDMQNLPLKDDTKETYKEVRARAIQSRLNTIDLMVQNTITKEKVIKG